MVVLEDDAVADRSEDQVVLAALSLQHRVRPYRLTRLERLPHALGDAVGIRQHGILQDVGGGQRDVRRGDAHRRAVEIVERLVGDDRDDLGAPAAQARVLLDGEQAVRPGDRAEDRLRVERHQRAHVDHLAVDAVLAP